MRSLLLQGNAIQPQEHWSNLSEACDRMFKDLIGKSMKDYVDDVLVKSEMVRDHIEHLN